jgi:hypothetical protein
LSKIGVIFNSFAICAFFLANYYYYYYYYYYGTSGGGGGGGVVVDDDDDDDDDDDGDVFCRESWQKTESFVLRVRGRIIRMLSLIHTRTEIGVLL